MMSEHIRFNYRVIEKNDDVINIKIGQIFIFIFYSSSSAFRPTILISIYFSFRYNGNKNVKSI